MAIDGNWSITMQSPMGARDVKAEFAASGGTLSGNFAGPQGSAPVPGPIDGNAATFAATVPGPMGELELQFAGNVDGDAMAGTVRIGGFRTGPPPPSDAQGTRARGGAL